MASSKAKYSFPFVAVFVLIFNLLLVSMKNMIRYNPSPYIDEIFHIPQAQRYCEGEFTKWDNKITTLPGLYLIALSILKPLEAVVGFKLCSVYGLRFTNIIGFINSFMVCFFIQQKLSPKQDRTGIIDVFSAFNTVFFPPLFFFVFLFYTDVWSTAVVLFMYNMHLSRCYYKAAVTGILAVLVRQTNIIWVVYLILDTVWSTIANRERRNVSCISAAIELAEMRIKWKLIRRLFWITLPYTIVCFLFLVFVIVNRGVVVGDRDAHSVVLHPMQALYFLDFAAFFSIPHLIFEIPELRSYVKKLPIICTVGVLFAILSECNLLEHPYLLADNRHLAFYIWKRIFGNRAIRKYLTPTYILSGLLILKVLKKVDIISVIILAVCIFVNLVPQYLFEIRYYIIPFVLLRLHYPHNRNAILMETVFFTLINTFVFFIYFNKTFMWSSEPGRTQRLIW